MSTNRPALGAVGALVVALLLGSWWSLAPGPAEYVPPVAGINNTALFLVTSDYGLTNVHVATAHALLERHSHIRLHFGSFPPMAPRLERVSAYSKKYTDQGITFHPVKGLSVIDSCRAAGKTTSNSVHPPGWTGISQICKDIQLFISPWSGEDYLAMYEQINQIIDSVNPAVVVLDSLFGPAIDATRDKNRLHAIVTPNTLIENFPAEQPWGKMFWKYPAMGSGFPYPVPWHKIPENIILNVRFISTMLNMPAIKEKQAFLRSKGLKDPINFLKLHRPDVPWISQTFLPASWPVDVIPQNVTCTGPMTLSLATVTEQDEDLAAWLAKAPTILISLGSGFMWSNDHAIAMAQAVAKLLPDTDFQVLWKIQKDEGTTDKFMDFLTPFSNNGRVRVERWLTADPSSLLESGLIVASVHHGGSGCYHEAISAGVPQVVLPQWLDLYAFAQLTEHIGLGVWGCRETSPYWTADCLYDAIFSVVRGDKSRAFQAKAKELSVIAQENPGRYVSAREIAKLAGSGV